MEADYVFHVTKPGDKLTLLIDQTDKDGALKAGFPVEGALNGASLIAGPSSADDAQGRRGHLGGFETRSKGKNPDRPRHPPSPLPMFRPRRWKPTHEGSR